MGLGGYRCLVRRSGTSTSVTTEPIALMATGGSLTFRITSAAKRVIDPNVDFHFKNGTATIAYSTITSIDYMNGEVSFAGAQADGSVTSLSFSGNYLPITTSSDVLLESRSFQLNQSADMLGTDVFTGDPTAPYRRRIQGLKDVSLDVESYASAADLTVLDTALQNGTHVVAEVSFGDDTIPRFRGLCLVEKVDRGNEVEGQNTTNISFKIAAVRNQTAGQVASYTFKAHPG